MLSIMRNSTAAAAVVLVGLASVPASSQDPYMAIHMDNQKINSAVSTHWRDLYGAASAPAISADKPNLETYADIEKHLGVVPKFFELFPETKLPALWSEYKSVQLNPNTALDAKTKQLIGLAVAAQANCGACVYFQTPAALVNGATGKEIQEAVAISEIEGNWSRILTDTTFDVVKRDTNTLVSMGTLKASPKTPAPTN